MSHLSNLQENFTSDTPSNFSKYKISSKSLAYQLPMNYQDYQEMKSHPSHDPGKKSDRYGATPTSSQTLRNPKSSMKPGETNQELEIVKEENPRDTPFFVTYKSAEDSDASSFDEKAIANQMKNEEQYKKLVQASIEQVTRLKSCKDQLTKQQEQIKSAEDDVTQAAEQSMAELTRKYQEAMKKVEDYYESCSWKIRDLENQKKEHLKGKFNENRFLISELISSVNSTETKIQLHPPQSYMETFDKDYAENEKLFERVSKGDTFLSKQWKSIPVPAFQISIDEIQSHSIAMPEDFSIGMSLVRTDDIDPLSTTNRTFNFLSPQPKFETTQDRSNFCGSPYMRNQVREVSSFVNQSDSKRRGHSDGLRVMNTNTLADSRGPSNMEKKPQGAIRIEDGDSMAVSRRDPRSRGDENNIREANRDRDRDRKEAKAKSISEAERAQKKITYKDIIRKMKQEAHEKDQVLNDVIRSYKDLERKYSKAVKEIKMKRAETMANADIYNEVLKSVTHIVEKHRGESRGEPRHKTETLVTTKRPSSLVRQRGGVHESQRIVETVDYLGESRNMHHNNFRMVDRHQDEQRTDETQRKFNRSLPRGEKERKQGREKTHSREKKYGAGIQMSTMFTENLETVNEGEMIDKIQFRDAANTKSIRIYIPFGQPTYSNYYLVGVEEDNTVDEVLQLLLDYLGMKDPKAYRYYLTYKTKEILPERSLIASERLWEYLDNENSRNPRWPRLYLRSHDNKFS